MHRLPCNFQSMHEIRVTQHDYLWVPLVWKLCYVTRYSTSTANACNSCRVTRFSTSTCMHRLPCNFQSMHEIRVTQHDYLWVPVVWKLCYVTRYSTSTANATIRVAWHDLVLVVWKSCHVSRYATGTVRNIHLKLYFLQLYMNFQTIYLDLVDL